MTKELFFGLVALAMTVHAAEFHVSPKGSDKTAGTRSEPLETISEAARRAMPGDVITVHEGVYRERVNPPRGGDSGDRRIVYQAAEGETAVIKGSEIIKGWKPVGNGVWMVTLDNDMFGDYNPYQVEIEGDWFDGRGRIHHTGEVFLNEKSLFEKPSLKEVEDPQPFKEARDVEASLYTWYCESNEKTTTIWANFHDHDPNQELVEISVRPVCFYPDKPGRNYITVRGFHMSQAATQWAPPTAEQPGLLGTHWSKGWIIENNVISNSKCSGITLGKERSTGQNVWSKDRSKGGDVHYNEVIVRALKIGWSKENIGSHIVRNNTIFDCEQTGMCGSLGAIFSTITNNHIYNIWTKRQFKGAEIAGIKIHAAIDVLIKDNHIHNAGRGVWMDWMAQGTRITSNLLYDNTTDDLFCEVDHGPYLIDNNILLSETSIRNWSEGGAFVHNLIAGLVSIRPSSRATPYHKAHSTALAGLVNIVNGDDRFYNNIFIKGESREPNQRPGDRTTNGYGLNVYDKAKLPMHVDGNAYCNGAAPFPGESNLLLLADFNPNPGIVAQEDSIFLEMTFDESMLAMYNTLVSSKLLGKAVIPNLAFENPDGSGFVIDYDYFGKKRGESPVVGPFELTEPGLHRFGVWPK